MKACFDCNGLGKSRVRIYSASGATWLSSDFETCSTCKGTGYIPDSMRKGFLGFRNLVDCWNCGRQGIPYNNYYTHLYIVMI